MKGLINKLIPHIHLLFLIYGVYGLYGKYEAHQVEVAAVESELPEIQNNLKKTEQKLKEIKDFVKKAEEYKIRVEEVAKTIESVQRQLPAETNDSQILSFFQQEMKLLNIRDPNLTPGSESATTFFISRDYNIKANGTFLQFLVFLERVGNAPRIYNVQKLRFNTENDAKRGRFQVVNAEATIQAYRYNPEFKVDRNPDPKVK